MKKLQFELAVLINGKPVREYVKDGNVFVEAKSGSNYSLKIKNHSWGNILAVISVDGIDVLKGKKATDADSGYVISAQNNVEIKGFRVDNDKEASFKFFEKGNGDGYAEVKGDASSAGVIGVRIYAEKKKPEPVVIKEYVPIYIDRPVLTPRTPYWYDMTYTTSGTDMYDSSTATYSADLSSTSVRPISANFMSLAAGDQPKKSFTSHKSAGGGLSAGNVLRSVVKPSSIQAEVKAEEQAKGFDMTTGWGQAVESKVTTVKFEIGELVAQIEILYASRESLAQMGIKFDSTATIAVPSAFSSSLNFCNPPPGWKA